MTYFSLTDARFYDAYVVYQTQFMDKDTEDMLSQFLNHVLPNVLEEKCGYRLFIHGRDDIPGQGRSQILWIFTRSFFWPIESLVYCNRQRYKKKVQKVQQQKTKKKK